jgi:hypothetical protein
MTPEMTFMTAYKMVDPIRAHHLPMKVKGGSSLPGLMSIPRTFSQFYLRCLSASDAGVNFGSSLNAAS